MRDDPPRPASNGFHVYPETSRQFCFRKHIQCVNGCDSWNCYQATKRAPPMCRECYERFWFANQTTDTAFDKFSVVTNLIKLQRGKPRKLTEKDRKELRAVHRELKRAEMIEAGRLARRMMRELQASDEWADADEMQ